MKVAFLDRDGTLIYEPKGGVVAPEDFRVLDGVSEGLRSLKQKGYVLVMVTNQTNFNREYFLKTQQLLLDHLRNDGVEFDAIFLCPHNDEHRCECRKPKPGMVTEFLKQNPVDLGNSFMVGDRLETDGGFAKAIGVRYVWKEANGPFPSIDTVLTV